LPEFPIVVGKVGNVDLALQRVARSPDALDEFLALLIVRVRFAGIDHLELAGPCGDGFEALDVVKEKVRAFVGSDATGEAECQDVRVHDGFRLAVNAVEELTFGLLMRIPNLLRRDVQRVAQHEIILAPARNVAGVPPI